MSEKKSSEPFGGANVIVNKKTDEPEPEPEPEPEQADTWIELYRAWQYSA